MKFFLWMWFFCWYLSSSAFALSVTVQPISPYEKVDDKKVYYATTGLLNSNPTGFFMDSGFKMLDLSASFLTLDTLRTTDHMVIYDLNVSDVSLKSGENLALTIYLNNDSSRPVPIAAVSTGATGPELCDDSLTLCQAVSSNYYTTAIFSNQATTLRVGVFPKDICLLYPGEKGCTTSNAVDPSSSLDFYFSVGAISDSDTTTQVSLSSSAVEIDQFFIDDDSSTDLPQLTSSGCTQAELGNVYFPGDKSIRIDASVFASASSASGAPLDKVIAIAQEGSDPDTTVSSGVAQTSIDAQPVHGRIDFVSGQTLSGFQNTTNGSDHSYVMLFSVRNKAGVVTAFQTGSSSNCRISGIQTSRVLGFLTENKCFLVTAVFQTKNNWVLELFRNFRKHILRPTSWGRVWIRSYERMSPPFALLILKHPFLRVLVFLLLIPAIAIAFFWMHPATLVLLFGGGFGLKWVFKKKKVLK